MIIEFSLSHLPDIIIKGRTPNATHAMPCHAIPHPAHQESVTMLESTQNQQRLGRPETFCGEIFPPPEKKNATPYLRLIVDFVNRVISYSSATAGPASSSTTRPAQAPGPRLSLRLRQGRNFDQWRFIFHTCVFQHICPLPAGPGVAVFQMLPEMVGTEELLRLVTLAELVHGRQMLDASTPVGRRHVGKFIAAVTAHIRVRRSWRRG